MEDNREGGLGRKWAGEEMQEAGKGIRGKNT